MEANMNGNINVNDSVPPIVSLNAENTSTYADVLRKDVPVITNAVQISNIDDLNNEVSLSDTTTTSEITNSCNETSELETTNATYESLDNAEGLQSDTTLEISNCFTDELENTTTDKKLNDTSEISTCSEATGDQFVSDSQTKTDPEVSALSVQEPSSATNKEENDSSSDLSSEEYNGSEEDSASEDDVNLVNVTEMYPNALKWQLRNNNPQLPETVTVLTSPSGSKVYLVGTAHFSTESHEDVAKTIRATQPDVVVVELCKGRVNILYLDEAAILEEAKNMSLEKIREAIRQNGVKQGILYLLLLNMTAHLTKQLGMAPGGEFRRAYLEARQIPHCNVQLGDRPIHITLQRALATLSLWKKLRIAWYMLTTKEPISKQEVERCKQKDLLEEMLAEMTGEFPELSEVFVRERDIYLAYSLQMAAKPIPSQISPTGDNPVVVVGVVGIGHVAGIVKNWNTVTEKDIHPIISIPGPSTCSKIIYAGIRYSAYGLILYGCYRVIPRTVWQRPIGVFGRVAAICASAIKQSSAKVPVPWKKS